MSEEPKETINETKFQELFLHVASWLKSDNFDMCSTMFFIDFRVYRELGHPLTGAPYHKVLDDTEPKSVIYAAMVPHKIFDPPIIALEAAGAVRFEPGPDFPLTGLSSIESAKKRGRAVAKFFTPLRPANYEVFSPEERAVLDSVSAELRPLSIDQLVEKLKTTDGWRLAKHLAKIPYHTAILPDGEVQASEEALRYGREVVAKKLGGLYTVPCSPTRHNLPFDGQMTVWV